MKKTCFVFGSNLKGIHGAGSAKAAFEEHGAVMGVGVGPTGNAYAIPTKDCNLRVMPLGTIKPYVDQFIEYASANPDVEFTLVRVGCGLAHYHDDEIAPMFADAPSNVIRPIGW